jgi:hypothetical protein
MQNGGSQHQEKYLHRRIASNQELSKNTLSENAKRFDVSKHAR